MAFTIEVREWEQAFSKGHTKLGLADWLQQELKDERDSKSPLVQTVEAFEQLQRVQNYLYQCTYTSDGFGTMSWAHWYDDIASAVEILRAQENMLRYTIAKRIGATLNS